MGRIRNPLYWRQYLGFESLSLRHIVAKKPRFTGLFCIRCILFPHLFPHLDFEGFLSWEACRLFPLQVYPSLRRAAFASIRVAGSLFRTC